ncbi:MAG: RING finger domain-containing protein [Promethearchaeota archaeon]
MMLHGVQLIDLTKEKRGKKEEERQPICGICKDPIVNEKVILQGCDHPYCHDCWSQWERGSSTCPVCRKEACRTMVIQLNKGRKMRDYDNDVQIMGSKIQRKRFTGYWWRRQQHD